MNVMPRRIPIFLWQRVLVLLSLSGHGQVCDSGLDEGERLT